MGIKVNTLILSILSIAGSAIAAEPVGQRTPNGGFEYYSNSEMGKGTYENGCFLPWWMAGHPVLGYNPKRVEMGNVTMFVDCKIPEKIVPAVHHLVVPVAPVASEVKHAPVVTPEVVPVPPVVKHKKHVRE